VLLAATSGSCKPKMYCHSCSIFANIFASRSTFPYKNKITLCLTLSEEHENKNGGIAVRQTNVFIYKFTIGFGQDRSRKQAKVDGLQIICSTSINIGKKVKCKAIPVIGL
jgi:hypothetical protein